MQRIERMFTDDKYFIFIRGNPLHPFNLRPIFKN